MSRFSFDFTFALVLTNNIVKSTDLNILLLMHDVTIFFKYIYTGEWLIPDRSTADTIPDNNLYKQALINPCMLTLGSHVYLFGGELSEEEKSLQDVYVWDDGIKFFVKNGDEIDVGNFNMVCVRYG